MLSTLLQRCIIIVMQIKLTFVVVVIVVVESSGQLMLACVTKITPRYEHLKK